PTAIAARSRPRFAGAGAGAGSAADASAAGSMSGCVSGGGGSISVSAMATGRGWHGSSVDGRVPSARSPGHGGPPVGGGNDPRDVDDGARLLELGRPHRRKPDVLHVVAQGHEEAERTIGGAGVLADDLRLELGALVDEDDRRLDAVDARDDGRDR